MALDERTQQSQPLNLEAIYGRLAASRAQRDEFRESQPKPADHQREEQQGWKDQAHGHEQQVGVQRQELFKAAEHASPEDIARIQGRLREQRQEIARSMSRESGQEQSGRSLREQGQRLDQGQEWHPGMLSERSMDRQASQSTRGQGWERQQGDTPRSNPAYGAAAETTADRAADRQLEQDQRTMHQALGRPATDAEMKAFEARRAQDQAKTQHGPSQEGQDLLARREERRRSMGMSQ